MSPAQLSRIFQEFSQADSSIARRYGGSGLGLAITRQLVQLHGGTLTVRSEPAVGSTFSFDLKVGRVAGHPASARPLAPTRGPGDASLGKVLLVENDAINREVALRMLERLGFVVYTAENGLEAVSAEEGTDFDLILMDNQMPVMDGLTATRRIREAEGRAGRARVPIIALTAGSAPSDRDECLRAGMNDYLSKPFRLGELYEVITRALASATADGPGG